ncbi:hypothetical protein JW707_02490 [Candidatus Woesearchaeota archaeon]|nr:hypothetical protein [Candidatus Woesearchaeota archaeon]
MEKKNEEVKEEEAKEFKKEKDSLVYWSIALIIAAVILFLAASRFYSKEPEYETVTYNNWEFQKIADMWWFEWQRGGNVYTVPLRFNPYEVKSVPIKGKVDTEKFNSKNYVYITFDFSEESSQNTTILALAATELTQNVATAINRTPIAACVNTLNEVCQERPIKTCGNTDEPVIYLKEGGSTGIILEGSCITLQGEGLELIKSVDRILYHWYNIIQ